MTRSYGPRKRTRADHERDLMLFVASARPDRVAGHTAASLAELFGTSVEFARGELAKRERLL